MSLELRPQLRPELRPIITPQLQWALKLLQLARTELQETVEEELLVNPLLERAEDPTADPEAAEQTQREHRAESTAIDPVLNVLDRMLSPDWQSYIDNHFNERHDYVPVDPLSDEAGQWRENRITTKTTLEDHLIWQIRLSRITKKEQFIGLYIIGNLDENGYLAVAPEEICTATQSTLDEVETVLKHIRFLDPVGVAARHLQECLLTQLENLGLSDSLAARIVSTCLEDLESKKYDMIAHKLRSSIDEVGNAAHVIISLEPRPSRGYQQDDIRFVVPDVIVERNGDVHLTDDDEPKLRLNVLYQRLARQEGDAGKQTRQYLKDKLRAAKWFIEAIDHRKTTLRRVSQSIFKFQREFLDCGVRRLRPMVLRDVAEDINVHESTVSRATANKWAETPHGIFELKWFFQSSISTHDGDVASESVKAQIRDIISKEDPRKPYSDEHIAARLSSDRIDIARRTVAKYREAMGILPSAKRRQRYF